MISLRLTILFWVFALAASLFYSFKNFDVFGVTTPGKERWAWWVHQCWFNFAGSLIGWGAAWFVARKLWHCLATNCQADLKWSDAALIAVAFVGITGHLPYATAGFLRGITDLGQKAASRIGG